MEDTTIATQNYESFDFNDSFDILKVHQSLVENGVVVIQNIYSKEDTRRLFSGILDEMALICPQGLSLVQNTNEKKYQWNNKFLPKQTRSGLFKNTFSNLHNVWEIRQNINIATIYANLHSIFKDRNIPLSDLFVSGDAINIRPTTLPISNKSTRNWAHLDQREMNNTYKCIQGQVVLNDSSASFVCSPKSHKIYDKLITLYNKECNDLENQWWMLKDNEIIEAQKLLKEIGGYWQIPIVAPAGSLILWLSTTIHSARIQTHKEFETKTNPFYGWRGVVYICYHSKSSIKERNVIKQRYNAFLHNIGTNHWGQQEKQQNFTDVYQVIEMPILNSFGESLVCKDL